MRIEKEISQTAKQPVGLAQLRFAVTVLPARLAAISRERASLKPSPTAWSAKQELGHLIDSAANNHQRIVRASLENNLALPSYANDARVRAR
jgi:hypothetical protein